MVGEIRDLETAQIAVKAALTGHLVLSTLHTNDAPSTIDRLINMGVEPFLLTSSINLIAAQRLVRRICDKCKEPIEVAPEALINLGVDASEAVQLFVGEAVITATRLGTEADSQFTKSSSCMKVSKN
jgi:type IV pilus assembly protein PilB